MTRPRRITIRYVDTTGDQNEVCDKFVDRNDICNMSGLIADMVASTDADVVDFTIAADGQEPLSPRTVCNDIVTFFSRCGSRFRISSISRFIEKMEALDPTPRAWEILDMRLCSALSSSVDIDFNIDYGDVDVKCSVMDGMVDILNEVAPYSEKLPDTESNIFEILSANTEYLDFTAATNPDAVHVMKDVAYHKLCSSLTNVAVRRHRYSAEREDGRRAYYVITISEYGKHVTFASRRFPA
jgi:hypothetical protein